MCESADAFSDISDATIILEALKKSSVLLTPSTEDYLKSSKSARQIRSCSERGRSESSKGISIIAKRIPLILAFILEILIHWLH